MRLIQGNALNPTQREQAEDLFSNRFCVIGKGKRYHTEDEWFDSRAFWAYDADHLAMGVSAEFAECEHAASYSDWIRRHSIPYMTRAEMVDYIKEKMGRE